VGGPGGRGPPSRHDSTGVRERDHGRPGRAGSANGHTWPMTLISVDTLAAALAAGDDTVRVADVRWYLGQPERGRDEYRAGHIPGADFIDLDRDLAAPSGPGRHPLPDPTAFAERLAALGFGSEHLIVAYDDAGGTIAARLWWMLDDLGHRRTAVLDGGLQAWREAGHPLSTAEPTHPRATLRLAPTWSRTVDRDALRGRLGSATVLDARAGERYRGEVEPVDPAAGHIPTALSAPANANLGPDGRFLPAAALRDRFAGLGIAGDADDVVTSCGSGVTACHNALAMRLAGLPDPLLYAGSFSDWSRCGEPVATGADPGTWLRED